MSLLEVTNLDTGYGSLKVLHGVSINVAENEVVAVVGPNGAGKTSMLKAIFGLLPVFSGTITLNGVNLHGMSLRARRQLPMALVPQSGGTFPDLTVEENLRTSYAILRGPDSEEALERAFALFPVLANRRNQRARLLSGGERQMLAFASGIGGRPQLLALDEPTTGLAPTIVNDLVGRILGFRDSGSAVLWVVEENPLGVLPHTDRVYVLAGGQVKAEMTAKELLDDVALQALFFGAGTEQQGM